jgi:hypothetical protein
MKIMLDLFDIIGYIKI